MNEIKIGIIGLDTSHVEGFTKLFNSQSPNEEIAACRVTAAYPHGSDDIQSSIERVPEYIRFVEQHAVEIVDSIEQLLERVDAVLLLTNDGRPHLRQVLPCFAAQKRVFIDKPIAGSLDDCVKIFQAADHFGVSTFSASALRFSSQTQAVRNGKYGKVIGADTFSPCIIEKTHPDLFWYGVHGVEILYTVMGIGCQTVWRATAEDTDVVMGQWQDGRIGTFRGTRTGTGAYGGTAFTTEKTLQAGPYDGYEAIGIEIAKFFKTGIVPVQPEETIELFAFMEAADLSKLKHGQPVEISDVLNPVKAHIENLDFDKLLQTGNLR